jgi:hypothetical protein
MAIQAAVITVAATPTLLSDAAKDRGGHRLTVAVPSGGATVFIGPVGVAAATGYPVAAGTSLTLVLESGENVYGIVAAATQAVNVLRTGRP